MVFYYASSLSSASGHFAFVGLLYSFFRLMPALLNLFYNLQLAGYQRLPIATKGARHSQTACVAQGQCSQPCPQAVSNGFSSAPCLFLLPAESHGLAKGREVGTVSLHSAPRTGGASSPARCTVRGGDLSPLFAPQGPEEQSANITAVLDHVR